jgi:pyruvate,water dikinase
VEALPTAELMNRLRVLGYLIIHTRQLDMIMRIPEQVRQQREKILREIGQMLDLVTLQAAERGNQ